MSSFSSYKVRKIIKPHKCLWCGNSILPKKDKVAAHNKGMHEWEWFSWYMHIHCEEASQRCEWVSTTGEIPEYENYEGITSDEFDEIVDYFSAPDNNLSIDRYIDVRRKIIERINNKEVTPIELLSIVRL